MSTAYRQPRAVNQRDETITNQIAADELEVRDILAITSTVSHVTTVGNDNSAFRSLDVN